MGLASSLPLKMRGMHTLQHSLCMFSARKCLVRMFAHVLLGIVWCHCLTLSVLETNKIEASCQSPGWYFLNMDNVSTDLISIYCRISIIYESHGVTKNTRTTRNWQTFHWMEQKMNALLAEKKKLWRPLTFSFLWSQPADFSETRKNARTCHHRPSLRSWHAWKRWARAAFKGGHGLLRFLAS